jgi:hypothetical protein
MSEYSSRRRSSQYPPPRSGRSAQYRRHRPGPVQSTKALTVKLTMFAVIVTLAIGGLIAAQMAAGKDPALGPKAAKHSKKASNSSSSGSSSGSGSSSSGSTGSSSSTDPYGQTYGDDGYYSGSSGYPSGSSGYSSGSSGYSGSGYSTQQSTPAPVTSSTS